MTDLTNKNASSWGGGGEGERQQNSPLIRTSNTTEKLSQGILGQPELAR